MKKAIVIEPNDIKAILAEKYHVPECNVIKSQYSYTVVLDSDKDKDDFHVAEEGDLQTSLDSSH